MGYYDAKDKPPRRKKKKKKKSDTKFTIMSVSKNSVNVSEWKNAPLSRFQFPKIKSGGKILGWGCAKRGKNPDATIEIIFEYG